MDDERLQQIRDDLQARAVAVEANAVNPGMPTLTGWLITLAGDLAELRARVEDLESER